MLWSTYLARGVSPLSSHADVLEDPAPAPASVAPAKTPEPAQSRVDQVLKYVEELFRQDGASPFSSKMAVGFLQVKLAACPEKMSRVVGYLLDR